MSGQMFSPQPNYSGVTIQIANPSVYAGGNTSGLNSRELCQQRQFVGGGNYCIQEPYTNVVENSPNMIGTSNPVGTNPNMVNALPNIPQPQVFSYPPQYYLNNYNYLNNPGQEEKGAGQVANKELNLADVNPSEVNSSSLNDQNKTNSVPSNLDTDDGAKDLSQTKDNPYLENGGNLNVTEKEGLTKNPLNDTNLQENSPVEEDMTKSENIINDLDKRAAEAEAEKKNKIKKDIVPLTDEYIKSLENYLNNPNDEIRLMASKEILTRLDEDKDRYDDAALNALLNNMLQDPSKLIRVAALSAFASQLASGNDYTITLLHNIQQNPNADKEDVLQAADILLKMSAGKEVKEIPTPMEQQSSESKG